MNCPVKEMAEKVTEPECMEDTKRTWSSKHNSTETHMNSQNLKHQAHGLYCSAQNGALELKGLHAPSLNQNLSPNYNHLQKKISFLKRSIPGEAINFYQQFKYTAVHDL